MEAHLLEEVLELIGVRNRTRSGDYVTFRCLFPWRHKSGQDRTPSMSVSVGSGMSWVRCFGCGYSKPLHVAIRELAARSPACGLSSLADWVEKNGGADVVHDSQQREEVIHDYTVQAKALMKYAFPQEAQDFLRSKGVTDSRVIEDNLLWHPRLQGIVFPFIQRRRGKTTIIGGGVRPLHPRPDAPKYWMLWRVESKRHLYGEWRTHEWEGQAILLVEGYFDVLHCWQEGVPCLGLMGKTFNPEKGKYLLAYGIRQVVLVVDPDVYETPEGLRTIQTSLTAIRSLGIEAHDAQVSRDPKYLDRKTLLSLKEESNGQDKTEARPCPRPRFRIRRDEPC